MAESLREVMSQVSLDDIRVEPDGRVQIANPEVASRISALKATAPREPITGHVNQHSCNESQCECPPPLPR
jgi:hypothetical protein